jgi:two-component sensor histidine kinase
MSTDTHPDNARSRLSITTSNFSLKASIADYKQRLWLSQRAEARLRAALAAEREKVRQRANLLRKQDMLYREKCHRLLNGIQMVASALSLESRAAPHPETAAQLVAASRRISMIGHIHQRLDFPDRSAAIAMKKFLMELCEDLSAMITRNNVENQAVLVEGSDLELPATIAVPLGCIASELIMNAIKHGEGKVVVSLSHNPEKGHTLSVCNAGAKQEKAKADTRQGGLGLLIIESLCQQIGAKLSIDARPQGGQVQAIVSFTPSASLTQGVGGTCT